MSSLANRLFLVEDSMEDEVLSLRAVQRCGVPCETVVVRHGGEALDLLLSSEGKVPNLIILDFHLPGLNGLEILRELRKNERTRFVPVVILSSLESPREVENCLLDGANSCVYKPVDPSAYVEFVGQIVRYWLTVNRRTG
jgi:two-component system response regulator